MRRAPPRGTSEPLRGFGSGEPGVGAGAGGVVPVASGWDGGLAPRGAGDLGGA